jgi:hypothetical protein
LLLWMQRSQAKHKYGLAILCWHCNTRGGSLNERTDLRTPSLQSSVNMSLDAPVCCVQVEAFWTLSTFQTCCSSRIFKPWVGVWMA